MEPTAAVPSLPAVPFDYGTLAEVDCVYLRQAAEQLRSTLAGGVAGLLAAGESLAKARRRLGRGKWEPWLLAEAQVPRRSASRLIAVHKTFAGVDAEVLARFTPTALYSLAQAGVPQSLREFAVAQARGGAKVTAGDVAAWLAGTRTRRPPAPKPDTSEEIARDAANAERERNTVNWLTLLGMLSSGDTMLHLTRATAEDGRRVLAGTLTTDAGRKTVRAESPEGVVNGLAGPDAVAVAIERCKLASRR